MWGKKKKIEKFSSKGILVDLSTFIFECTSNKCKNIS